jgi:hypothetical protein
MCALFERHGSVHETSFQRAVTIAAVFRQCHNTVYKTQRSPETLIHIYGLQVFIGTKPSESVIFLRKSYAHS